MDKNNYASGDYLTSEDIIKSVLIAADSKKATDITVLNVGQKVSFTDYFVIACGSNKKQIEAISNSIEESLLEDFHLKPIGIEGQEECKWLLMDFGDVVVHIFQPETRDYYQIETLFNDVDKIDASLFIEVSDE